MSSTNPIARVSWQSLVDLLPTYPPAILSRQPAINFVTAMWVVNHFMGGEWIDRHVNPFKTRPGPLRLKIEGDVGLGAVSGQKLVDLGEALLNLQHIQGFDSCIRRLRNGDLEPTLAELAIAGMLYINDLPFRFVESTGVKRSDYDYEITFSDSLKVCADAKCKIESTALSENTISNALKKAHGQLPEEQPGIVLIKFSPSWLEIPDHLDTFLRPTNEFFVSHTRVVSVAFYTTPVNFDGTSMMQAHRFMELGNARNKFDTRRDWRLFNRWRPPKGATNGLPPKWLRLINFPHGFH